MRYVGLVGNDVNVVMTQHVSMYILLHNVKV